MEKKEVKKWQDEEALKRYRMIAPLLDPDLDEGKKQQLREEAAEKNGISKRTLYRYEKGYREGGSDGLRPEGRTKKRQQRLPGNGCPSMGLCQRRRLSGCSKSPNRQPKRFCGT